MGQHVDRLGVRAHDARHGGIYEICGRSQPDRDIKCLGVGAGVEVQAGNRACDGHVATHPGYDRRPVRFEAVGHVRERTQRHQSDRPVSALQRPEKGVPIRGWIGTRGRRCVPAAVGPMASRTPGHGALQGVRRAGTSGLPARPSTCRPFRVVAASDALPHVVVTAASASSGDRAASASATASSIPASVSMTTGAGGWRVVPGSPNLSAMSTPTADYADLIARFGKAWEKGDTDAIVALFTENGVFLPSPFEARLNGQEAIRTYWKDIPYEQVEIAFRSGEMFIVGPWFATEFRCTFRRRRTGEPVDIRGALFCETEGTKLSEMRMYWHRDVRAR